MVKARQALIKEEIVEALQEKEAVLLMLSTTMCPPCKHLTPIFFEIAEGYPNITFIKANLDEVPEINQIVSTGSVPTLVFYKKGIEVYRTLGFMEGSKLRALIERHLQ
ncbi:thiol reductase thioredoxin [Candidatus Mycoplasma haematobovis]|uniref:Thiol reductase thioredoxin n=1 Tax=Candidatus Mycoplasma haematobovis TaxID=432608 RepID=A0A1A9QEJ9_9MOLU|nr:thioredoxin family protein [Candidatus Mycoplasma haematobovis]OAL10119.1 thiol reductase thioredoxin [Candidatus Mycoplasma haematobovis]